MTKAEKFNLYADTLYGMCRKAQDTVPEACVSFECRVFRRKKLGRYRTIYVGITTAEGSRKYYDVCEALQSSAGEIVLLDCGCNYKKILRWIDYQINNVSGVLLSHEHAMNVCGTGPESIRGV